MEAYSGAKCQICSVQTTGSPTKHENLKTTWGILTDVSERIKGHFIKPVKN